MSLPLVCGCFEGRGRIHLSHQNIPSYNNKYVLSKLIVGGVDSEMRTALSQSYLCTHIQTHTHTHTHAPQGSVLCFQPKFCPNLLRGHCRSHTDTAPKGPFQGQKVSLDQVPHMRRCFKGPGRFGVPTLDSCISSQTLALRENCIY